QLHPRRRHRPRRREGSVLMASEFMRPVPATPVSAGPSPGRRARGLRRALGPIAGARGLPKWVLCIGIAVVLAFVVFAIFAPWISPYKFDQYLTTSGQRFPKSG